MKWEKKISRLGYDMWKAQGKNGHFLLWKDGRIWRGLYMRKSDGSVQFRFWKRTIKDAKNFCENNHYWER